MAGEWPADVLRDLRCDCGESRREFARILGEGYSYEIVRNLETFVDELPRTAFGPEHLKILRDRGIIVAGDKWDIRVTEAMHW